MNNIRIIRTGINVSKILKQLQKYPKDWNYQKNLPNSTILNPDVYISESGVLQLVIGTVESADEYVFDSEGCMPAPAYYRHTEAIEIGRAHV
mgnify:FL=1